MNVNEALGLVRHLIGLGQTREIALNNPAVPVELRDKVRIELKREDNITLEPARFIIENKEKEDWLQQADCSNWYYWPTLKMHLISKRNWSEAAVCSLD